MNDPDDMSSDGGSSGRGRSDFESRSQRLFQHSTQQLDGRTRSKLTQARHAALDELHSTSHRPVWMRWWPAGAVTAAAVLAVMLTLQSSQQPRDEAVLPLDDFDIVATAEDLQIVEDFDFYEWLPAELDHSDGPAAVTASQSG